MAGTMMAKPPSVYNNPTFIHPKKNKKAMNKWIIFLLLPLLNACSGTYPTDREISPTDGNPLGIRFTMPEADAQTETNTESRAALGNAMTEFLKDGVQFRVYAYSVSDGTEASTAAGSAIYTIKTDNDGTNGTFADASTSQSGSIKLYRGTYNFYLISYNETSEAPSFSEDDGKTLSVSNGKDFMYVTLKNVVVQAEEGASYITIPVTTPFTRLCSKVSVAVKADATQPKKILSLTVNSIQMDNIPSARNYTRGNAAWKDEDITYGDASEAQWKSFGSNAGSETDGYYFVASDNLLFLPASPAEGLKFKVNLSIGYNKNDNTSTSVTDTDTKTYEVSIPKALLPGTKYLFEFALTFFGNLGNGELSLSVKAYDERELTTDDIGGDEE
ncbi:hypothetical protein [Phocaeicola sp.]